MITKYGKFSITIESSELARGLRPTSRLARNQKYLTQCQGAVGIDNVLQALSKLTDDLIDFTGYTFTFPFPQLFTFKKIIIIADRTDVYELVSGSLVHKINVTAGLTWSAVDFYNYIYMSNGKVAVTRAAEDQAWDVVTSLPICSGMCDLNGQVVIGAPGVEVV